MLFQHPFYHLALIGWLVGMLTVPAQTPLPGANQVWLPLMFQHHMVELESFGDDQTRAYGINQQGQIVGVSHVSDPYQVVAARWTPDGGIERIAPLYGNSEAFAINTHGHIVGTMDDQQQAFLWTSESGVQTLGSLGGGHTLARDINDQDQVVGESMTTSFRSHAFLREPDGQIQDLGTLGGITSQATAINNHGQVVGMSEITNETVRAFLWTAEHGMLDLGTPADTWSLAIDINDHGQVLGAMVNHKTWQRTFFLWSPETGLIDLATRGCQFTNVSALNNRGQIIGARNIGPDVTEAALCQPDGSMVDLGALGMYGSMARDINDAGTVVGESMMAATMFQRRATQWGT